ncbi:hypothetical protein PQ469_25970 [Mucilaginibacter sp. KACC 22773]|uniref:hypothetical protein n=1 Tax=Mucilaginibacter sp. KACC 22773 TaxID=3025671 RepID=UPI00236575C4|nr:hypothetical protein [Mucilaginibacter sp. KACC 22773]WDF77336.1 hypothetical protein PQ469_25970 [Mucilaginibacter sp. KACC 22773]
MFTNTNSPDNQGLNTKWAPWIIISIYHTILLVAASWITLAVMYPQSFAPLFLSAPFKDLKNPLLCFSFGMIGGTLNASRQVIKAVKEDDYQRNRMLWQILTPLHSGIFAVVSIIFIKSGLNAAAGNTTNASNNASSLYFIMITSFLVGFSTEIFIKRLIGATEALFGEKNNISEIGRESESSQRGRGRTPQE